MNLPWARILIVLAVLAAVGIFGWSQRDSAMGYWIRQLASSVDEPPQTPPAPGSARGSMVPAGKAVPGLNKCRIGKTVTYTDQSCPPGSRAAPVEEGGLTVLPSSPAPAKAGPRQPPGRRARRRRARRARGPRMRTCPPAAICGRAAPSPRPEARR